MNLFRENWPLGWTPQQDDMNGDPQGLLRADNLRQDERGILSLIRGTKKVSSGPFGNAPTQIFGHTMDLASIAGAGYTNNSKVRYVVDGTTVLRNYGPANKSEIAFDLGVITGGGNTGVGYCFSFGHAFIFSGTKKYKDDGARITPIGILGPDSPDVSVNPPPSILCTPAVGSTTDESFVLWENIENESVFTPHADYLEIDSDSSTLRASAMRGLTNPFSIDLNKMDGIADTGKENDVFEMSVRIGDTDKFISVQVTFNLDTPTGTGFNSDFKDYYELTFSIGDARPKFIEPIVPEEIAWEDRASFIERARREFEASLPIYLNSEFTKGVNQWSKIQCLRSDFARVGSNDSKNWSHVSGIRVTFVGVDQSQTYVVNEMRFIGGANGPLTGKYAYVQVDVQNNGFYTEKSLAGNLSQEVDVFKASVRVIPKTVQIEANECWIFRSGGKLNGFYLCKKLTGAYGFSPGQFDDIETDTDLLRVNIRLDDFQDNLPDGIIGAVGNFKGRNWYLTYEDLFPSYRDNYSSYDKRYKLETAGRNTEINYFIAKVNVDTMILATNLDFYEITGTAGVISDGQIEIFDVNIRSLGINTPAISKSFVVREGNLFYVAADGIRVLSGSTCSLLSSGIDLLFRNETRHGISPTRVKTLLGENYYLGLSKNRLLFSTVQTDNKRSLYVYDFGLKVWRYEEHGDTDSIMALFVEEDDTIVYSTASFGDKFLRLLDQGTLLNESDKIPFLFRTVYDSNGQPRNRKDSFTFKIIADTGNDPINITIRGFTGAGKTSDSNLTRAHNAIERFDGRQERHFAVYTNLQTVKYYQVEISGTTGVFKLYNFSLDYEPRPEQLSVLRIPPSNLGIAGRKRIPEIPMLIDTLGNEVTFRPIIDGVPQIPSSHGTVDKQVSTHYFTADISGFTVGGILTGTLFEFYELIAPRNVELLPDPSRYKHIPYTNLGTSSRKRFIQYAIVIDTRGVNVQMVPIIDGLLQVPQTINTARKQTVIYTFDNFAVGIDIACILDGSDIATDTPFEFYNVSLDDCISEKLPPVAQTLTIPYTNLKTSSRKRISQFAFEIDTRGQIVTYTPLVDGEAHPTKTFSTQRRETVIYTFAKPVTGVDIGGTLQSTGDFEYYGPNFEESVYEKLPPKAKALQLSCTNYGIAAKKRIRTVPFVIDTSGSPVTFKVMVDGKPYPSASFTTDHKQTCLYYFENDNNNPGAPFGIDYCYSLEGVNDFEFYELLKPENVELLPVGKKFDQFGPVEFAKVGKIREISIRMVPTGSLFNFKIYASDSPILTGHVLTAPNLERTYPISVPKGVNPNIFRMEIHSPDVFHRFDVRLKVNIDGSQTQNKIITLK